MSTSKSLLKEFNRIDTLLNSSKDFKSLYEFSLLRGHFKASIYKSGFRYKIDKYSDIKTFVNSTSVNIKDKLNNLPKNSYVGFVSPSNRKWHIVFWAILKAGFIPVLINEKNNDKEILELLESNNVNNLIAYKNFTTNKKVILLDDIYSEQLKEEYNNWSDEVGFCTSGTEGRMKLCFYKGENIIHQVASAKQLPYINTDIMYTDYQGTYRNLAILPFSHIFGFVAVYLWSFFFNKTIVYPDQLTFDSIQEITRKTKVTHIYSVPLFWNRIASKIKERIEELPLEKKEAVYNMIDYNNGKEMPKFQYFSYAKAFLKIVRNRVFGDNIRFLISGGGYIKDNTIKLINGIGYKLHNGYGLTEAGVVSVDLSNNRKSMILNSIGKPFYGIEFKIKDNQDIGNLLIKSNINYEYYLDQGIKKSNDNEWLDTCDIVKIDNEGRYYILGRKKDILINENGENVSPDAIENHFYEELTKESICCVTVDNSRIVLVIFTKEKINQDLISNLKDRLDKQNYSLSRYKRVSDYYITNSDLPVDNSMKTSRVKVLNSLLEKEYISFKDVIVDDVKYKKRYPKLIKYLEEITDILSDILKIDSDQLDVEKNLLENYDFDSFKYLELILKLEKEYNIEIENELASPCKNIIDYSILVRKLCSERVD